MGVRSTWVRGVCGALFSTSLARGGSRCRGTSVWGRVVFRSQVPETADGGTSRTTARTACGADPATRKCRQRTSKRNSAGRDALAYPRQFLPRRVNTRRVAARIFRCRLGIPMDLVGIPIESCAEYPFGAVVVARSCRLRRSRIWPRGWPPGSRGDLSGWCSVPLFVVTRVTGVARVTRRGGLGVELGERLGGAAGGGGGGVAHGPGLPGGRVGGCPAELGCRAGRRAGDD